MLALKQKHMMLHKLLLLLIIVARPQLGGGFEASNNLLFFRRSRICRVSVCFYLNPSFPHLSLFQRESPISRIKVWNGFVFIALSVFESNPIYRLLISCYWSINYNILACVRSVPLTHRVDCVTTGLLVCGLINSEIIGIIVLN